MNIDWINPTEEMIVGLQAGREESLEIINNLEDELENNNSVLLYEEYIAQLIGIDHKKLTFDFRGNKLTVRELEKEAHYKLTSPYGIKELTNEK